MGGVDLVMYMDSVLCYFNKMAFYILIMFGVDDIGSGEYVQCIYMLVVGVDFVGDDLGDFYDIILFFYFEIGGVQYYFYLVVNNFEVFGQGLCIVVVVCYENIVCLDYNGYYVIFDLEVIKY